MHILTSVYGCPLVVIPQTPEQTEKFLSVKGATEISAAVFESNANNLTQEAASRDQGLKVNDFVDGCECWRFVNTKIIKS